MSLIGSIRSRIALAPHRFLYGPGPRIASALRKAWVRFKHPAADIRFGPGVYLGPGFSLHIPHRGTFHVGADTEFRRGFRAEVHDDGVVTIGDRCNFTYDVLMQCTRGIEVGSDVQMGQASIVVDGNHRYSDIETPFLQQGYDFRDVVIEDGVTIHSKVTVVDRIGERSVVGANAVITKPMPAYCVIAGVPARPISYFGPGEPPPELAG